MQHDFPEHLICFLSIPHLLFDIVPHLPLKRNIHKFFYWLYQLLEVSPKSNVKKLYHVHLRYQLCFQILNSNNFQKLEKNHLTH